MKRPDHITDVYVLEQAQDDIESANGHEGNPIEGDAKVTADFDNFDLSVDTYEEEGTTVFCVTGSVDVHYEFRTGSLMTVTRRTPYMPHGLWSTFRIRQ